MRKAFIIGAVGAILTAGGATAAIAAAATDDHPRTPLTTSTTPAAASTTISETDARRIAAESVPGATITETGLESVGGRQAWKIHLNTTTGRQEVFVDAATGQILRTDRSNGDTPRPTPATTSSRMIPIPSRATPTTTRQDDRPSTDDHGHRGGADDGPGHDVGDDHGGR
jgi:uncharacterized membrane protein YkoI